MENTNERDLELEKTVIEKKAIAEENTNFSQTASLLKSIGSISITLGFLLMGISFNGLKIGKYHEILEIPWFIGELVALIMAGAGYLLLMRKDLGRILFIIFLPISIIGISMGMSFILWKTDIPIYATLAILLYIPLVFWLTRGRTLFLLSTRNYGFFSQGIIWLLLSFIITILSFLLINQYHQMFLEITLLLLSCYYFGAFIFAIIPAVDPSAYESDKHKQKRILFGFIWIGFLILSVYLYFTRPDLKGKNAFERHSGIVLPENAKVKQVYFSVDPYDQNTFVTWMILMPDSSMINDLLSKGFSKTIIIDYSEDYFYDYQWHYFFGFEDTNIPEAYYCFKGGIYYQHKVLCSKDGKKSVHSFNLQRLPFVVTSKKTLPNQ